MLLGYIGAAGIVAFGLRSAQVAIMGGRAADYDPTAFAVLAASAAALGVYAISLGDPVFAIANIASALANGAVAFVALRARPAARLV